MKNSFAIYRVAVGLRDVFCCAASFSGSLLKAIFFFFSNMFTAVND